MDGESLKQRDAVQDEPTKEAKVRQRRELVPYADSLGEESDNRKENASEVKVQPAGVTFVPLFSPVAGERRADLSCGALIALSCCIILNLRVCPRGWRNQGAASRSLG